MLTCRILPISHRKRAAAKHLIEHYFLQLTEGCGNADCKNEFCASCPDFRPLDNNAAAVKALELFKINAKLCRPPPLKKESDTPSLDCDPIDTSQLELSDADYSGNVKVLIETGCSHFPLLNYAFLLFCADVHYLTETTVCMILSFCEEEGDYSPLVRVIGRIFSSADALMKSFKKDDPSELLGASSAAALPNEAHGDMSDLCEVTVDVCAVRRVYDRLLAIDQVEQAFVNALIHLSANMELDLEYLNVYETNPDYLNIFIIVMENSNLHSPEYLEEALPQFCRALIKLPVSGLARLSKLWSTCGLLHIRHVIETFQQLITFTVISNEYDEENLVNDDETVVAATQCLKVAFYASIQGGEVDVGNNEEDEEDLGSDELTLHELLGEEQLYRKGPWVDPLEKELNVRPIDAIKPLIPFEDFINESLNEVLEVDRDFTFFKVNEEVKFSFQSCPFILTVFNKSRGLYYDNRISMYSERRRSAFYSMTQDTEPNPFLRLKVRRDHIIDDALVQVSSCTVCMCCMCMGCSLSLLPLTTTLCCSWR